MEKTKKYLLISLSILLTLLMALSLNTQKIIAKANYDTNVNKITVVGTHFERYSPDTAYVTLGVESLNENLNDAKTENTNNMNKVIQILKQNNINEKDIKTKRYNIYEKYSYSNNKFLGNSISNIIEFKTNDLKNIDSLITKLTENGANHVSGVKFTIENNSTLYNEVLKKAMANAKEKAMALNPEAKNMRASEIIEDYSYINNYCFETFSLAKSSKISNICDGEIKISASVKVTFEM